MKIAVFLGILACLAHMITAPPVTQKKPGDQNVEGDSEVKDHLEDYMEYHRYLKEVVQALESDPEFRAKLEKAEEVDIRTGKIAHELDFVNHNVRTKLDEIKRNELERLRHFATKQFELTNDIDTAHAKISSQVEHVDHNNPHTFEIEDLKKLIAKTTADLAEGDNKRREEFKEYEMQKEFEKQQKLQSLDETHRKEYEKEMKEKEEKHKKHEPLHHPGSRQQLEEVWEKQDHMENQDFDPKTFFMLHDVDSNGVWDQTEVKALFLKELDKMYQNGAPEDDMRERQEEMERMREHVFKEADTNGDGLISYEEFLIQTRRAEFEKDQGWKGLDEQQVYTPEEYQNFERNRLEEVQRLVQQGVLPPQALYGHPNQQYHPNSDVYQQGHGQFQQQQFAPPPQQFNHQGNPQYQGQGYPQNPQGYPQQQVYQQGHPQQQQQGYQQGHPQQQPGHPQQQQGYPQQQGHPQQQQGYQQQAHPQQQQVHPQQQGPPQQQARPQQPQQQGHPQQVNSQQNQGQQPQVQAQPPQVQAQAQPVQPQVQQPKVDAPAVGGGQPQQPSNHGNVQSDNNQNNQQGGGHQPAQGDSQKHPNSV